MRYDHEDFELFFVYSLRLLRLLVLFIPVSASIPKYMRTGNVGEYLKVTPHFPLL